MLVIPERHWGCHTVYPNKLSTYQIVGSQRCGGESQVIPQLWSAFRDARGGMLTDTNSGLFEWAIVRQPESVSLSRGQRFPVRVPP